MLEKRIITERIEVLPESGHVQVRQRISILEDGEELSYTYHRYVLEKDVDIENQPDEVKRIALAAWSK